MNDVVSGAELTVVNPSQHAVAQRPSFFTMEPEAQIGYAARIATVLKDVIDKQKLYSNIQGKNYVKVEGWQTLGTFLGVTAKERTVNRLDDGSYEAFVDLVKFADGTIVGGASALCSINERRWATADEYARRSMAVTRATGKAYRCAFSWIVTLAGYEATAEEEAHDIPEARPAQDLSKVISTDAANAEKYTGTTEQQAKVKAHCEREKIDPKYWQEIDERLQGMVFTRINVGKVIRQVLGS